MTTRKNIRVLENTIRDMVSETKTEAKADGIRQEIEAAYNAVKAVKKKLRGLGKMNKETKVLKAAARKMVDELEDLEDLDMEEEVSEQDEETIRKNEQSEGYGSWQGLGMTESIMKSLKKNIRGDIGGGVRKLNESEMNNLIQMAVGKKNLLQEVSKTYSLIRRQIIKERVSSLKTVNYRLPLHEQGQYNRDPGIAAAEGIEVIIDNLKKGWSMIKDSTTRKQIQNTLAKLNNFMMYSAELVGSGSSQRNPRSYDQIANPLPFPELDEPEDLEDIDDELGGF
tara:strand:+ start:438 stop:1283 length:846 start_codon:yes stop_codon:yes gene_type:complete